MYLYTADGGRVSVPTNIPYTTVHENFAHRAQFYSSFESMCNSMCEMLVHFFIPQFKIAYRNYDLISKQLHFICVVELIRLVLLINTIKYNIEVLIQIRSDVLKCGWNDLRW